MGIRRRKSVLIALNWRDERIVQGIARYAAEHRWHLSCEMLFSRHVMYGWSGDGAITGYGPQLADLIAKLDVPKVDISLADMPVQTPRVAVDNEEVGALAAEHLVNCGFRNFACFGTPRVWAPEQRRAAFRRALCRLGVPEACITEIVMPPGRVVRHWPEYRAFMTKQLRALPKPACIYCGQESRAADLVDIAVASGLRVPDDIAVLGTDNIGYLCECQAVTLSSIDTRLDELGYQAAAQLGRLMRGEIGTDAEPVLIRPAGVVQRQSTDIAAVSHPPVSRTLRYIRKHFRESISPADLQAVSDMSERGLQKAFIRMIGRTPAAERRRMRLQHARHMLVNTDEKVEDIARECGYSSSTNLGTALKRETGLSPRAYRRKSRGG